MVVTLAGRIIIIYSQKRKKLLHRFWRQEKGKKCNKRPTRIAPKRAPGTCSLNAFQVALRTLSKTFVTGMSIFGLGMGLSDTRCTRTTPRP